MLSAIFGILGIGSTVVIYQQKTRKGLILSKLVSNVIWFLYYFLITAYSGASIAGIGMIRELVFINKEKKWAKHPLWLVFFLVLSVICGFLTWKNVFSLLPCIASVISVISFWIGNPRLSRILSYPISACMLTYDIACSAVLGIVNELLTVTSSIIGAIRLDRAKKQ